MKKIITSFFITFFVLSASFANFAGDQNMPNNDQTLTPQQEKIALIAAFTANGDLPKLKVALNDGLDAGLSVNEIKEVLLQMNAYAGFPRSLHGINTFMEVMQERQQKGISDEPGEEPKPVRTDRNKYDIGKDNLARLTGITPSGAPTGANAFVPGVDVFLKEHLFADIFERGVLDFKTREIATISALMSIKGVEPMLQSHIGMGMNVGLSETQVRQLVALIGKNVGQQEADTANKVLLTVLESKK